MKRHAIALSGALLSGALLFGALLFGLPASADWLVTRDGERVETRGAWKVKGGQVVFTRPNGSLAALRKADVDLEASAAATEESLRDDRDAAAADAPAAARRRSVLVLTDADIPAAATEEEAEESEEDSEDAEDEDAETPAEPVRVVSWGSREPDGFDGLEIYGMARNTGDGIIAGIRLKVIVRDDDGKTILDTTAFLKKAGLTPGQSTSFKAMLPGIYVLLRDPTFEVTSEGLTVMGRAKPEGSESEDEAFEDPAG